MTRVLLVDDKEENLYYLSVLLRGTGYEVETAMHGAEALVKARRTPPNVIVSDLLMPVMDGYTLLRHWKADAQLKAIPFIVYTATYTAPEDEKLALDLGADGFILKPAEPDAFLDRIREIRLTPAGTPLSPPNDHIADEKTLYREYSATLIRKLEEKTLELEQANKTLTEDIAARELAEAALRLALAARDDAERQAQERAALLDALFESVPDVVTHLDLDGTVQLVNHVAPPPASESTLGASWLEASPSEQRERMKHAFDTVVSTGKATSFESSRRNTDGNTIAEWTTIAPVAREGRITGVVVVARDITERKLTEAQLLVSDRMASVGTLAAGVAHEINNPLTYVTANLAIANEQVEALAKQYPVPSDLIDAVHDARDGAERVRMIVRDLKMFSRGEEEARGPVDVEQVLESTIRMAWNELRHRARLVRKFNRVPAVEANESRLGQLLLNLLVNAAQAIPEGKYDENEIVVETLADPATKRIVIRVTDTGAGIPKEVQSRLFTPFFTTKAIGVGTGLGLSICHRIATGLGGTIDFTSEVGKGTSFRVMLPMADLEAHRKPADKTGANTASRRGRVLVVDDETAITQVVTRILSAQHDVVVVDRAEKALALFAAGERFDVVLCDLMMPQATGMDLYAHLLELDRDQAAQVVFMTGGAFTSDARAFLDRVPNQRIEKPFEIQGLRALVNRFVR
jgi:PAS domain S-box-containing protein